ncbi:MAG: hypothetical protein LBR08_08960 [Bacteroidales bacterium]|jgi:hypothetical protein|nr:hypothetical protein [Bacteroidales bacterium]
MFDRFLYIIVFIVFALQTMISCTCSRTRPDDFVIPDSIHDVSPEMLHDLSDDIVDNLSSSIETASLFKSLDVPFSQKYLASTKNISDYHTACDKAFNLGVFGADLGYLNMYGKTSMVSVYVLAMKNLADGISIGQFFNYATLKRLSDNNENIDSLIYISQQSFNRMDRYLRQSGRGNLSVVMICGVWIEALHLSCRFYVETANVRLAETIGEQKIMLAELVRMLQLYRNREETAALAEALTLLQNAYEPIEISVQAGDLDRIEQDGNLRIVQNETTVVHYTGEQIDEIVRTVELVRNKLIRQ